MATVYIWYTNINNNNASPGHASLLSDANRTYISWWPKTAGSGTRDGALLESYEADTKSMGRAADKQIHLNHLPEDVIAKWARDLKSGQIKYNNLLSGDKAFSSAGAIATILQDASGKAPDIKEEIWTPEKVMFFALKIQPAITPATPANSMKSRL